MKQRSLFLIATLAASLHLSAQEGKQWTLNDCINYALEKNIQLQQNKLSLEESEIRHQKCPGSSLSQLIVQYGTQYREPSLSGEQCNRKRQRDHQQ